MMCWIIFYNHNIMMFWIIFYNHKISFLISQNYVMKSGQLPCLLSMELSNSFYFHNVIMMRYEA